MKCVKYSVFLFNLLFLVFGALLIGLGVYVQAELNQYLDFFEAGVANGPAVVLITFGAITFVVAFFGCCGAIKENHCMTITFAALIGLILICEFGGGIAAYVLKGDVNELVSDGMKDSMKRYHTSTGVAKTWDTIQKDLHCCGTNSPTDWIKLLQKIPASCTCERKEDCPGGLTGTPFTEGCLPKFKDFVASNIGIIAGAGVGLAVVEIIGMLLACCLAKEVRSRNQYV